MFHTIFFNRKIVYRSEIDDEPRQLKRIFSEFHLGRYCPRTLDLTAYELDYPILKALREPYPDLIIDWDNDELVLNKYEIQKLGRFLENVYLESLNEQYSNLFMFYEGGRVLYGWPKESEPTYQKYTYAQALALPNSMQIECAFNTPLDKKIKEFDQKTDFFFYRVIDTIVRFAEENPNQDNYCFCSH